MSILDDIRPIEKINLINLVHAAGIDTSDWANYGDGNKPPSQNPRYCYEWSFIDQNKVVLNLWHNNFTEESDKVSQRIDFKTVENQLEGVRLSRFIKLREAIEFAFTENIQVRVVICLSEDGSMRTVDKRVLDSEPWTIASYDKNIGCCILERGIKLKKYVDQFQLQDADAKDPRRRDVTGSAFCRSADVRRKALERAQGQCEYCGAPGFKMVNNEIYLETHHVIPLSDNGPDNISNVAALCPNHHREAHHGQNRKDINEILMSKFSGR